MKESDKTIETILVQELEQHNTRADFGTIWTDHDRRKGKVKGLKKSVLAPVIAFFSFLLIFTGGFAAAKVLSNPVRTDNTDYTFVQDEAVIGKWDVVDFISEIEYYDPEYKTTQTPLYLDSLAFLPNGIMLDAINDSPLAFSESAWTKDYIISKKNQTASKYVIREINGLNYMFYEWKSGDYIFRNMEPKYYVLKQADIKDYSDWSPTRTEDNIEYPFEDDPKLLGKWETVDFVDRTWQFEPKNKKDDFINYLVGMVMEENGKLTHITFSGDFSSKEITWTKGLILNKIDKTASKYEIMESNGNTYLFYEWKSGDYIFRNMNPSYYVLKKIDQ